MCHGQRPRPPIDGKEHLAFGRHRRPPPRLRGLQALDGFVCPERAVLDGPEDGVQLVELPLVDRQITEAIPGKGTPRLLRRDTL